MGKRDDKIEDSGQDAGSAGTPKSEAGKQDELPLVESPSLDAASSAAASDAEAPGAAADRNGARAILLRAADAAGETESEPVGARARSARSFRFAVLAATIALAAGVGSFLGSLTASGLNHSADAAIPRTAQARDLVAAMKVQLAEISRLKSSLDVANRNSSAQFAKIATRLDGLERAELEPSAKLVHIADAVDRLEKREAAAPDITGSIPAENQPALHAPPLGPILSDWIVQDVGNGRAMVESRYGGLFVVGSGSRLPGLGRVESVRRQDGQWLVVTERGVISSPR